MYEKHRPITFPKDESAHHSVIEWWYFNGHLKDKQNNAYSFMNCLFRADVKKVKIPFLNKAPFNIIYFSHSIVSDIKSKKFISRMSPFSIVSGDSFQKPQLYINYINPAIKKNYVNCVIEKVGKTYHMKNEDINLAMVAMKKPLLEGGNGFLDLHSKKTYYYSLTSLTTEGEIKINNKWIKVAGKSWMDHQWSNAKYSNDKWVWFSLQLDNGTEIVCFVYDNNKAKTYLADISYPDDKQEHYEKVEIVSTGPNWASPKSKAVYPLAYTIKIPEKNIELKTTAIIENQEMLFGSINYWEGPVRVEGFFGNKKVTGVGFMELVGCESQYNNIKYMQDELRKAVKQFTLYAKKKTSRIAHSIKRGLTFK